MKLTREQSRQIAEEILESLDLDLITSEVNAQEAGVADWDAQSVGECLVTTAEKWLARDVHEMMINPEEGIERKFEWAGEKGFVDLHGVFGDDVAIPGLAGKRFVLDWKTTAGKLDPKWEAKYRRSFQWKLYLYHLDAEVFIYRGVSRNGETREVIIHRPDNLHENLRTQLLGLRAAAEGLVQIGLPVWPMSMPYACNAFGRECENYTDCGNYTMPKQSLETWNWSHTSMEQFLLCPERMRRAQLRKQAGEEMESNAAAEFGSAFHRGVAEIYRQVWGRGEMG